MLRRSEEVEEQIVGVTRGDRYAILTPSLFVENEITYFMAYFGLECWCLSRAHLIKTPEPMHLVSIGFREGIASDSIHLAFICFYSHGI